VSTSVDRVSPTQKLRCSAARRDPGGGINVARVVRRLGSDATAIYPRGGATGELLIRLIEHEGIAIDTSQIDQDFSVQEETTGKQFRFVLPGPVLLESEWQACLDTLSAFGGRPDFVVASGSLPPGVPPDFYARACRITKSRNAKFVLDTSGPALNTALEEGVFLVKPNLRELAEVVGEPLADEASWIRAGAGLVKSRRAEVVALTLDHRGALLVDRDRVLRAEALPIKPMSSVGAGDSFLGGIVWSLTAGFDLEHAFRLGVAAGSSAVLNLGTELAHSDDTRRLAAKVVVRAL
jgi:6-phosphofructokinase 2